MNPDYRKAADIAAETVARFNLSPKNTDPLFVLNRLPNVLIIPYSANQPCDICGDNQDAFTLVNSDNGKLQYIIIYNQGIPQTKLRFALSRELAHVALKHDGISPEYVWSEEANCFAYHFICPIIKKSKPVNYRPIIRNLLWAMKSIQAFDSLDDLKAHIADEQTKYSRFIGKKDIFFSPSDVKLSSSCRTDRITGWKNCYDIVVDGKTVGFCGE